MTPRRSLQKEQDPENIFDAVERITPEERKILVYVDLFAKFRINEQEEKNPNPYSKKLMEVYDRLERLIGEERMRLFTLWVREDKDGRLRSVDELETFSKKAVRRLSNNRSP